jgi:hypothetical protein
MMGEPSIFKMKRRAEALAKILPVFALSWQQKSGQFPYELVSKKFVQIHYVISRKSSQ